MKFNKLIKSQFKDEAEIVTPLHWMDIMPQILVVPSHRFTNQLSVVWKHPQIAMHDLSTYIMDDRLWKMVLFPAGKPNTSSWLF